jgi:hypothetical protein
MIIDFVEKFILRRPKKRQIGEALLIDLSAIMIWRGVWGFMDLYLFPNHPEISFILSITVGITLMGLVRFFSRR